METVNLSGAIISINAASNVAKVEIIECLIGELQFSLGERNFVSEICHNGESTSTGALTFPEGTFQVIYDSSDADAAQLMLEDALNQVNDFTSDKTLEMEIEFNNSKGLSGALMSAELLVGSFTVTLTSEGNSKVDVKYKQLAPFTMTAATGP